MRYYERQGEEAQKGIELEVVAKVVERAALEGRIGSERD